HFWKVSFCFRFDRCMLASFLRLYPDQYPSSPGHRLPKEWASHHKMQRKFQWNTAICHSSNVLHLVYLVRLSTTRKTLRKTAACSLRPAACCVIDEVFFRRSFFAQCD
ncbi:hypothetical protein V3C99_017260, partial [Haemonchus contortus]